MKTPNSGISTMQKPPVMNIHPNMTFWDVQHEMAKSLRPSMSPGEQQVAARFCGVVGDQWTTEAENRFAQFWVAYMRSRPDVTQWSHEGYAYERVACPPEMHALLNRYFGNVRLDKNEGHFAEWLGGVVGTVIYSAKVRRLLIVAVVIAVLTWIAVRA